MKKLNLLQRIGIIGTTALVLTGCFSRTNNYNPHSLFYIETTLSDPDVVGHLGESAAVDKTIRDLRAGKINVKQASSVFSKYSDNIKHHVESASYYKALRELEQ